ncbi:MAG: hypothetical protein ACYCT2_02655 [Thermoplasmataceae archaeon]
MNNMRTGKEFLNGDLTVVSRVILFSIGFLLLNLAFLVFFVFGYNYPIYLVLTWILIIFAFLLLVLSVLVKPQPRSAKTRECENPSETPNFHNKGNRVSQYIIPVAFSIALFGIMYVLQSFARLPGTDEINIDYYAGYLVLHGLNPYITTNMSGVFAFTGFPLYLTTPILTGGYVTSFGYPALTALVMIPAVALNLQPASVPLLFSAGIFVLVYFSLSKSTSPGKTALIAVLASLSVYYSYIAIGGTMDSIWAFFVIFSYITRKNPILTGVLFGIAIALKQLPIILLPFFLILAYFETGKRVKGPLKFLVAAFGAFMIPNLPFLIASPVAWLKGITSIVTTPLMGVGFGPSALAFMGYARIPPAFFTVLMILVFLFLIGIYITHFDRLKYAFLVFPLLILIFNFRVETDYLNVWPLLLLPVISEIGIMSTATNSAAEAPRVNAPRKHHFLRADFRVLATIVLTVAIVASAASAGSYLSAKQPGSPPFTITSILNHTVQAPSGKFISSMTIAVFYQPGEGNDKSIPALFAIYIPSNSSTIFSGVLYPLLWNSDSNITPGNNTITVRPDFNYDLIPSNTSFEIMEYYGYSFAYLRSGGMS